MASYQKFHQKEPLSLLFKACSLNSLRDLFHIKHNLNQKEGGAEVAKGRGNRGRKIIVLSLFFILPNDFRTAHAFLSFKVKLKTMGT